MNQKRNTKFRDTTAKPKTQQQQIKYKTKNTTATSPLTENRKGRSFLNIRLLLIGHSV